MKTLSLEGVRCFREQQQLPIRPITLLVGENSTGKSTALAMLRAAWDVSFAPTEPDFNEKPFDLGGYDTIAHYHGGQAKRVQSFSISTEYPAQHKTPRRSAVGTFADHAGQPLLVSWSVTEGETSLSVQSDGAGKARVVGKHRSKVVLDTAIEATAGVHPRNLAGVALRRSFVTKKTKKTVTVNLTEGETRLFDVIWGRRSIQEPRPIAVAPIRTAPERTYNPRRGTQDPEGAHMPMTLAALHATDRPEYDALMKRVAEYGAESKLFGAVQVKRLGKKAGDPFQIHVANEKFAFNLRDVGYGVSQVLPILIEALTAPDGQMFLLQQPEVHLHPRAQAALGTLFVEQAVAKRQTFVVETHSDHLVDRVRMEVRDRKKLKPADVIILYFERRGGKAIASPITIDEQGDLVDAPSDYRQFFLEEERRFLGI